jgi:carbon storage regulator
MKAPLDQNLDQVELFFVSPPSLDWTAEAGEREPEEYPKELDQFDPANTEERPMLVLTRRIDDEIVIGGNIHVVVVAVKGDRVRLGIKAPPSIPVDRKEVHERRAEFAIEPDPAMLI